MIYHDSDPVFAYEYRAGGNAEGQTQIGNLFI